MQPQNTFIVISRHKKNTEWAKKLVEDGFHVAVYDHEPSDYGYYVPTNAGREASVYLKYIIDHYDSLFTFTIFVHDDEKSWHHSGSLVDVITTTPPSLYKSLNNLCMSSILENDKMPYMRVYFKKYLEPYIGSIDKYSDWTVGEKCCAQFIVHKKRILQYPKKFYEDIYRWLLATKLDAKSAGHLLEWTWGLIFDNPFKHHKLTVKSLQQRQETRKSDTNNKQKCRRL